MNMDRFKFRATFSTSYYDENGNDKDIKLTVYDVAVYSGGEIGFSAQQIETIINALKLSEIEQDTIWQFINDNYATSSYEWFVCNNAIIEQCTGLKDKNRNLIYEGDILQHSWRAKGVVRFGKYTGCFAAGWENIYVDLTGWYLDDYYEPDDCGRLRINLDNTHDSITEEDASDFEIIGNIHEQKEQQ